MELLSYMVAIATIFFGYKLWIKRVNSGSKFSDLKGLLVGFVTCLVLLWVINIVIGFVQ